MGLLNKTTYIILRAEEGSYVDGEYISGDRVQVEITGNIQPNKPAFQLITDNAALMAGDKDSSIKIFSVQPLYNIENSPSKKADVVIFDNKMWEVRTTSGLRQGIGLRHYHSTAEYIERIDDGNGLPIIGDPLYEYPYPEWRTLSPAPDGIITEFTFSIPFIRINSGIVFNGSVPMARTGYTIAENGETITFSEIPLTDDILSAYGV
jgi:hypothetical protein